MKKYRGIILFCCLILLMTGCAKGNTLSATADFETISPTEAPPSLTQMGDWQDISLHTSEVQGFPDEKMLPGIFHISNGQMFSVTAPPADMSQVPAGLPYSIVRKAVDGTDQTIDTVVTPTAPDRSLLAAAVSNEWIWWMEAVYSEKPDVWVYGKKLSDGSVVEVDHMQLQRFTPEYSFFAAGDLLAYQPDIRSEDQRIFLYNGATGKCTVVNDQKSSETNSDNSFLTGCSDHAVVWTQTSFSDLGMMDQGDVYVYDIVADKRYKIAGDAGHVFVGGAITGNHLVVRVLPTGAEVHDAGWSHPEAELWHYRFDTASWDFRVLSSALEDVSIGYPLVVGKYLTWTADMNAKASPLMIDMDAQKIYQKPMLAADAEGMMWWYLTDQDLFYKRMTDETPVLQRVTLK